MRAPRTLLIALAVVALASTSCGSFGKDSVAVIGDSIIHWNRDAIAAELEDCCKPDVAGFSGARSDQMVDAARTMGESTPRVAIIDLGTNDALQGRDVGTTRLAITGIIEAFSESRCIYLVNISTSIGGAPNVSDRADQINATAVAINAMFDELAAADSKVEVIDWNAAIVDAFREGRNLTEDRVHPNDEGLAELTAEFRSAVSRCNG